MSAAYCLSGYVGFEKKEEWRKGTRYDRRYKWRNGQLFPVMEYEI